MKKLVSLALVLALTLSLSVTTFAGEVTHGDNHTHNYAETNDNIDITANYSTKPDKTENTYKVKIDWEAPVFSYEFDGKTYTWNTTDLKYDETKLPGAGWASATGTLSLTVTNYSDKAVDCSAALTDDVDDGVTVSFTATNGTAAAAVTFGENETVADKTAEGSGQETTCNLGGTITVSGTPNDDTKTTLAKVTVTVKAAA